MNWQSSEIIVTLCYALRYSMCFSCCSLWFYQSLMRIQEEDLVTEKSTWKILLWGTSFFGSTPSSFNHFLSLFSSNFFALLLPPPPTSTVLFQQSNATQEIKLSFLHFFGKRVQITDNQGFVYIRQSGRQKKTYFFCTVGSTFITGCLLS